MEKVNWGIIGLGDIANSFAETFDVKNAAVLAAGSRNLQKAQDFCEKYSIAKAYGNYESLLFDPDIDVVYIATPNSYHAELIIKALERGKHVFCEKAITVNQKELNKALALAKEKNLIVAEAMTIYHMPLFRKIKEMLVNEELGKLKMVHSMFGSLKENDSQNRFFSKELGGGALLDIGVYALAFIRFFLSSQPDFISTTANLHETGVDEEASAIFKNKENEIASVSIAFRSKIPKQGLIVCEEGYITVMNYPRASEAVITYPDGSAKTIQAGDTSSAMNYEAQAMTDSILTNEDTTYINLTQDVTELIDSLSSEWGMDLSRS